MTSELEAIAAAFRRSEKRTEKLREELAAAIIKASDRGTRQVDIVTATGYTRERVRQIIKATGIKAG